MGSQRSGDRGLLKRKGSDRPGGAVTESVPYGVRLAAAWSWRLLLIGAVIAVAVFLISWLRLIVIPLLVAVLLSALLAPFVAWLRRHHWPKWLAITVAMVGALAVTAGLLTLGISQIAAGSTELRERGGQLWEEFQAWLLASPLQLSEVQLSELVNNNVFASLREDSGVLITSALSVGTRLGHFLAGTLLVLFATLFMLIDGAGIWKWIVGIFPRRARRALYGAGRAGWSTLTTFVRVQILVATIDAVGIGLGAFLLGLPLVIPIVILVFLGSFIPIVGAIVTGAIAVIIALIYNGWVAAILMLAIVLLVQQIEGHVLQPLIMGSAVKVHPLGVVLAVATGSFLAGIVGALFAVPVVAVLNVMIGYISRGAWKQSHSQNSIQSRLWQIVPQRHPGFRGAGQGKQPG